MSTPSDTPARPRLSELDMRIGQTVQLLVQGPQLRKYYTRLIGFVEHEFIMLRVPVENGWTVTLDEGLRLDVRVFSGVSLFEFQSHLQAMLLNPRNYMLLSCPDQIRQTRLRSHERAKCHLPVQLLQTPGTAPAHTHTGFRLDDLSGSGAALVGPHVLGEPGQHLQLALNFHLAATDSQEQLVLDADIQSVQPVRNPSQAAPAQDTAYHHGLRFRQIDPRILLLVHELQ